ncbi:hypothetical protein C8Q78DRAFT_1064603 [Trametes maxima]|nr:hypothetical protein C8Q78DRAFT_1064603 [Trametes maxima]
MAAAPTPTNNHVAEAVKTVKDTSLSPEDVAKRIVHTCRKLADIGHAGREADSDNTELEWMTFLDGLWYAMIEIALQDSALHDRLAGILLAIEATRAEPDDFRRWGNEYKWTSLPGWGLAARESMNGGHTFYVSAATIPMTRSFLLVAVGTEVMGDGGEWYRDHDDPEIYAALAGDPPSDSAPSRAAARARSRWLNMNTFMARLWALGAWDCAFYGISTMRMCLEPYSLPPETRERETNDPEELDVEVASVWVRVAGKKMYECREIWGPKGNPDWNPHAGAPGSSGGTWDGVDGYHPERWAHWKGIFKKISEGEGRRNMVEAARAAVDAMESVEKDTA